MSISYDIYSEIKKIIDLCDESDTHGFIPCGTGQYHHSRDATLIMCSLS